MVINVCSTTATIFALIKFDFSSSISCTNDPVCGTGSEQLNIRHYASWVLYCPGNGRGQLHGGNPSAITETTRLTSNREV